MCEMCPPLDKICKENPCGEKTPAVWLQGRLRDLSRAVPNCKFIFGLDEFQQLYVGGSHNDRQAVAGAIKVRTFEMLHLNYKSLLLDTESPCWFVLSGSLQATFWYCYNLAPQNGSSMNGQRVTLSTQTKSSPEEINGCRAALKLESTAITDELMDQIIQQSNQLISTCFLSQVK